MTQEKIHTMNKIKNWKEHWTNSFPDAWDDSEIDDGKKNTEVYLSKLASIKVNLNIETEVLKKQKLEFTSMVVRLQRGQKEIHQEKYKQPTVENYIKTLKDYIIDLSQELNKRGEE